jgi:catechol 2,3-dioxygenase-like lactoylglutathione lyase family enzyme
MSDPAAPIDPDRSRRFYRDTLGLAVYRAFGPLADPGMVFFLGQGLLQISGTIRRRSRADTRPVAPGPRHPGRAGTLIAAGVTVLRPLRVEPWGLVKM